MRNLTLWLSLLGAAVIGFLVLLPVLGLILFAVLTVLLLTAGAFLAAPLLARLPWFRDRIRVDERDGRRTVRFGSAVFTTQQGRPHRDPAEGFRRVEGEVIDVEGRELPEKE
ncbi:MAG: hypothetical protein ACOY5W_17135 [Pseudomonadota bacterium]